VADPETVSLGALRTSGLAIWNPYVWSACPRGPMVPGFGPTSPCPVWWCGASRRCRREELYVAAGSAVDRRASSPRRAFSIAGVTGVLVKRAGGSRRLALCRWWRDARRCGRSAISVGLFPRLSIVLGPGNQRPPGCLEPVAARSEALPARCAVAGSVLVVCGTPSGPAPSGARWPFVGSVGGDSCWLAVVGFPPD